MTSRRHLLIGWLCGLLLVGCGELPPSPTPTASPSGLDFTVPGVASLMVQRLTAKADNRQALIVEITRTTASVSVLGAEHKPVTWAYRDGDIKEVTSDLQYVDQATFDVSRFNLSDVGGLFRAAEGQSGSGENQRLTIVDYSGGEVMMSVATVPESRTVFFEPDGSLLQTIDFDTRGGIAEGITDVVGSRVQVYSITVDSAQGAWVDYPGDTGTTIRRTRTSKVPVTTNVTTQQVDLPLFLAIKVEPDAVWNVLDSIRGTTEVPEDAAWSVVIEDREKLGAPRMYFAVGSKVLVTDLAGEVVSG